MSETVEKNNVRYFIAKSQDSQSLQRCIEHGVWACRDRSAAPHPKDILSAAFQQGKVFLLFSVNGCHGWHGYCQMTSTPSKDATKTTNSKSGDEKSKIKDSDWFHFSVLWSEDIKTFKGERFLSFEKTDEMFAVDGTPVNKARNWQEVSLQIGDMMCKLIDTCVSSLKEKVTAKRQEMETSKPDPFLDSKIMTENSTEFYWKTFVKKVEKELGKVHLACPFGSQRYNLSTPESDIDVFIVYQAKTTDILGFNPPKQTIKNSEKEVCDYTVLEIFRYTELLLTGDARCVETLFLHESAIIYASSEWRDLYRSDSRRLLLTSQCLDKYLRDAQGSNGVKQLVKWRANHKDDEKVPPKINKLCYVIIRLLQNANDVVDGEDIKVYRIDDSEEKQFLMSLRIGELTYTQIWAKICRLQENIEKKKDNLKDDKPGLQTFLENWLLCQRKNDFISNT